MARGFGATYGVASTDIIRSQLDTHTDLRTWSIWTFRNGDGGGNGGRMFDRLNAVQILFNTGAPNNHYRFGQNFTVASGQWSFPRPAVGEWHHICVTYDSSSTTNDPICYVDGVSQTVTEVTTPVGEAGFLPGRVDIGNRIFDSARNWDGMLAEPAIYDRILTPREVASLAARFSPLFNMRTCVEYLDFIRTNTSRKLAAPTITGTAVQPHPPIIYPYKASPIDLPVAPVGGGDGDYWRWMNRKRRR